MPRYFIEVSYKGTAFSGFQSQENSFTIQGEIERVFQTVLRIPISTTTSSRTDAGVHSHQNFLHADLPFELSAKNIYNMNAVLHQDIVMQNLYLVPENAHARFNATSRHYRYFIHQTKNPFLYFTSYFHPQTLQLDIMNEAAQRLIKQIDFTSFAKRNSDVNNFNCHLQQANWSVNELGQFVFSVESNRFLRGMVRALVATQILVGKGKISLSEFDDILQAQDCTKADFSAPAHGLFLESVHYPDLLLAQPILNI